MVLTFRRQAFGYLQPGSMPGALWAMEEFTGLGVTKQMATSAAGSQSSNVGYDYAVYPSFRNVFPYCFDGFDRYFSNQSSTGIMSLSMLAQPCACLGRTRSW